MKQFIRTAFKIILFDIILLAIVCGWKYLTSTFKIFSDTEKLLSQYYIGAGCIYLVVFIIFKGYIEGDAFEKWRKASNNKFIKKLIEAFFGWGYVIALLLVLTLLLTYHFSFTSMLSVYLILIFLRNCFSFLKNRGQNNG